MSARQPVRWTERARTIGAVLGILAFVVLCGALMWMTSDGTGYAP